MARRTGKTVPQEPPHPPQLTVKREKAQEDITKQITEGEEMLTWKGHSQEDQEKLLSDHHLWADYSFELLRRIFNTDEISQDFLRAASHASNIFGRRDTMRAKTEFTLHTIKYQVENLRSVLKRLPLIEEAAEVATDPHTVARTTEIPLDSKKVFVVHGHDTEAKLEVARFLERLGLEAVILHEQANVGKTIIEKFEMHADVGFAIVLLTPDDMGGVKAQSDQQAANLKPRARQNVVFELGYFIGKLGRGRVCPLYKEGVELPSDMAGVVYTPMDAGGGWKMALVKELKAAKIEFDANRAFS